jgi:outer membrane protein TolC
MFRSLIYTFVLISFAAAQDGGPAQQAPAAAPTEPQAQNLKPPRDDGKDAEPWVFTPSYWKRRFATPSPRVELQSPIRLSDFVVDGKLELSLRSYLELVMANNPDVSIQKLQVEFQRNGIVRASAIFDPFMQFNFNPVRSNTATSDQLAGALALSTLNQPVNFNWTHTLDTGASYQVAFNGLRTSNNNAFQFFNPSITTRLGVNFSQPLLRGRGSSITRIPMFIARSRLKQADFNLEDQLINLIAQAESAYWNVVEARESLRVQEANLKLADEALKRARRELELGATSQLEIFQPEANYANAQIFVTQARYRLAQTEDALRRQIGADIDESVKSLPLVLTEPVAPPTDAGELNKEGLVSAAIARRPDLRATRQGLDIDDLNIRNNTNALRPDIALTAQYSIFGRGGNFFPRPGTVLPDGTVVPPGGSFFIPGGVGDALSGMFGLNYPTYGMGLSIRLPVRDRRVSADLADALVSKKQNALRVRSTEQNIRLQVLNAINQVENSRASVELAKVARDVAQKRVEAELKRYELGTTVIFFVLQAQQDLTAAESALVRESINYRRNLLNLLQRTGQLLDERGISVQ